MEKCILVFVLTAAIVLGIVPLLAAGQHHSAYQPAEQQCGIYGSPPCDFEPAPVGSVPFCAGPGKTYCEHAPNYPKNQIRKLIKKLRYDIRTHLVDESGDEFSDKAIRPDTRYGPPQPPQTYGVPTPPLPPVYERPPSPTYGVPQHTYGPPTQPSLTTPTVPVTDSITRSTFKRNDSPNYYPYDNAQNRPPFDDGYNYNKPNAGGGATAAKPAQLKAPSQSSEEQDESDDGSNESGKKGFNYKSVHITTDLPPQNAFFGEPIQQQSIVQVAPNTQSSYLPNSPPAPFSTAASPQQQQRTTQKKSSRQQQQPIFQRQQQQQQQSTSTAFPTVQTDTVPPAIGARDYYGENATPFNRAELFKRYARALANKGGAQSPATTTTTAPTTTVALPKERRRYNQTFYDELKNKQETLRILYPDGDSELEGEHDLFIGFGNKTRRKRQGFEPINLCETTIQIIQPQAGLSKGGDWKYIVNQVESVRQLVKVEHCASTTCNNVCQFPLGYKAVCEQKYVQKRLVTLDKKGQKLYTDTFWFPSCCLCSISNE